jgi:EAL domain-containing protein (putative c-di-GMP-specific phosphodiesterase class I)
VIVQTLAHRGVLSGVSIRSVYQPIVDLWTREVVGFEALARGPAGSPLESPDELFEAAHAAGVVAELDWECRAAAVGGALAAGLPGALRLFVNAEPTAMATPCPDHIVDTMRAAQRRLRPVLEVTERALTTDPAGLLAAVRDARRNGWDIALDDVGADPASLSLMPFLEPDVIKLDLRLVQQRTGVEAAAIMNAVMAHSERTGAIILAEGIETEAHRQKALALGATLGQGWLFGRPGALPPTMPAPAQPLRGLTHVERDGATPFELIEGHKRTRVASKELLLPMSHHLERQALRSGEPLVVVSAFEHVDHFTDATRQRYSTLARHAAFVAALGVGMPAEPVAGVRGARLDDDDRLGGEWVVTCVGPHFAGALIARDLNDAGPDRQRRFAYVVTHDRDTVTTAARTMLDKVVPAPAPA